MTQAQILQFQVMQRFWDKLYNLTDAELMTRKQMEMEQGHSLKRINDELNRRIKQL